MPHRTPIGKLPVLTLNLLSLRASPSPIYLGILYDTVDRFYIKLPQKDSNNDCLQFRAPGAPDNPLLPRQARARAQASQDGGTDLRLGKVTTLMYENL